VPPSLQPPGRPTWAEIDLGAVVDNYAALGSLLPRSDAARTSARLIPVIKADAYGHGAVPVARVLEAAGARMLAVALVEEGAALRNAGIASEILVLEGAWPGQERDALDLDLIAAVHDPEGIRRLQAAAEPLGRSAAVHLKIDTGMSRLGAPWDRLEPVIEALRASDRIRLSGTFSHLAQAEEQDTAFTAEQTGRFRRALDRLRDSNLDPGEIHLANSAGLLYQPAPAGWSARPGIALYGYPPAPERCPVALRPAMQVVTRIGRIRTLQTGESVGYSRLFVAPRPCRIATLPIGYADGYRRGLTGKGRGILHGRWASVLGAVSMDMIVVDVTAIPEAGLGDPVVLLGSSGSCRMDASDWASLLDTIPYEICCGISPRIPRRYRQPARRPPE